MRTSKMFKTLIAGALLLAGGQAFAGNGTPPVSFNIGLNGTNVSQSEEGCGGGQGGLSFSKVLILRLQSTHVSYEADDDTDTCDGVYWGDAGATENSATAGFVLGNSGLFIAGGPARVDFEHTNYGAWGTDTGSRVELGWSSRLAYGSPVGVEVLAFATDTEIRDYQGLAVSVTFGPRASTPSKWKSRRAKDRY